MMSMAFPTPEYCAVPCPKKGCKDCCNQPGDHGGIHCDIHGHKWGNPYWDAQLNRGEEQVLELTGAGP